MKAILAAARALPAGYALAHEDLDHHVLASLGINAAEDQAFLAETRPTYLGYESWLRERSTTIDREPPSFAPDETAVARAHDYDWELLRSSARSRPPGGTSVPAGRLAFDRSGRLR